jgi:hypothetical protein
MQKGYTIELRPIGFYMLVILMTVSNYSSGQYNGGNQFEFFFGNYPSARNEAMGRSDVAIGGSVSSLFVNPAGLGGIQHQEVQFSTSGPFYVLRNTDYYFLGYARRILPKIVAAISMNKMAIGPTTFKINIGGKRYPLDKPATTNFALSVAGEGFKNLYFGLNVNFYKLKAFNDVPAFFTMLFDAGAMYKLDLKNGEKIDQYLQFGLSVVNGTSSNLKLTSPDGIEESSVLPVISKIGASYFLDTKINIPKAGKGSLDFILTVEYQNVLNYAFRTGYNLGFESVLWKVLAFRLGYYNHSIDPGSFLNNKTQLTSLTYGFGLIVPLAKITNNKIPFNLHFDYINQKQPSYTYEGSKFYMRAFTFRLSWPLNENQ